MELTMNELLIMKQANSLVYYDGADLRWKNDLKIRGQGHIGGTLATYVHNGYKKFHMRVDGLRKHIRAHRFIYWLENGSLPRSVDHIDLDKLNNAISNLRASTSLQQELNKGLQSTNTSGFKGVTQLKGFYDGFYRAQIRIEKLIVIGRYRTAQIASDAYDDWLLFNLPDDLIVFAWLNRYGRCLPTLKEVEEARGAQLK